MPLSSGRSRSRLPLFRSLSASTDATAAATNVAVDDDVDIDDVNNNNTHPHLPQSRHTSTGFGLPTFSTLTGFNRNRRARTKSSSKRKSVEDRWKCGESRGQDREQGKEGADEGERQQQQQEEEDKQQSRLRSTPATLANTNGASQNNESGCSPRHPRPNNLQLSSTTATAASLSPSPSPSPGPLAAGRAATEAAVRGSASAPAPTAPATATTTTTSRAATATSSPSLARLPLAASASTATAEHSGPEQPEHEAEPTLTSTSFSLSTTTTATTTPQPDTTSDNTDNTPNTLPTTPSLSNNPTSLLSATIASDAKPPPPVVLIQQPSTPTVPSLPTLSAPRHDLLEEMLRKIWVKRPGASPTRVEVAEEDLVDSIRDVILHKYANSLGRSIDAPDITLKIVSRELSNKNVSAERPLGPEEPIGATLDAYYPGGQTIEEALIIEVASRRTPRASPRTGNPQISYYYPDQYRPDDGAREYFPPMPLHSPHLAHVPHPNAVPHAMTVLTTGQLPPLPSPGSHGQRRHRPKYGRQHTSSPTILHTVQSNGQVIDPKSQLNGPVPAAPPIPTPPAQAQNDHKPSITPPNRVSSPHSGQKLKRRKNPAARSASGDAPPPSSKSGPNLSNLLDGSVPPINVLLVEDNVINLKLLEAFMKRLKVRWKSAMNGKEAVAMWRTGGFHLVLMDIQLPVMNGLEATKEIRRLEAVNGIGVFSGSPIETGLKMPPKNGCPVGEADALPDRSLFKSPVIIVALTASSLQSDRHEALAAGCNDFLTKPVNFVWMERKVSEWGCMQALIDFDGWRKWKAYADEKAREDPAKKAAEEKEEKAKAKAALKAMFSRPPPSIKKDSGGSTGSSNATDRATTPVQNGVPKKSGGSGSGSASTPVRSHKSSRSNASGVGGGSLGSMAEEDEKAS